MYIYICIYIYNIYIYIYKIYIYIYRKLFMQKFTLVMVFPINSAIAQAVAAP